MLVVVDRVALARVVVDSLIQDSEVSGGLVDVCLGGRLVGEARPWFGDKVSSAWVCSSGRCVGTLI